MLKRQKAIRKLNGPLNSSVHVLSSDRTTQNNKGRACPSLVGYSLEVDFFPLKEGREERGIVGIVVFVGLISGLRE